jgi:hypothetical protein
MRNEFQSRQFAFCLKIILSLRPPPIMWSPEGETQMLEGTITVSEKGNGGPARDSLHSIGHPVDPFPLSDVAYLLNTPPLPLLAVFGLLLPVSRRSRLSNFPSLSFSVPQETSAGALPMVCPISLSPPPSSTPCQPLITHTCFGGLLLVNRTVA